VNKSALMTILGAAALTVFKNKSSSQGSFGLKRNKYYEEINKKLQDDISDLLEYAKDQLADTDDYISLLDAAKALPTMNSEQKESLLHQGDNCPEMYVYTSLYLAFITQTYAIFSEKEFEDFSTEMNVGGHGYGIANQYWRKIRSIKEDIEYIRELSEYKDQCFSEDLCNEIMSKLTAVLPLELDNSLFAMAINGYIATQMTRLHAAVLGDKNLAEMCKQAILKLDERGEIRFIDSEKEIYFGKWEDRNRAYRLDKEIKGLFALTGYYQISLFMQDIILRTLNKITSLTEEQKRLVKIACSRLKTTVPATYTTATELQSQNKRNFRSDVMSIFGLEDYCTSLITLGYQEDAIELWDLENSMGCIHIMQHEDHMGYDEFTYTDLGRLLISVWGRNFSINTLEEYMECVSELRDKFSEFETTDIDVTFAHTIEEYCDNNSRITNAFGIGQETIALSQRDIILGQLPFGDIDQSYIESFGERPEVSRIILVEYRNPNTLTSITENTPGNLCVGRDSMGYKGKLQKGQQRHFGVLAQTEDGYHVMYHTHADGNQLRFFTDSGNKEDTDVHEHEEILDKAREMINNVLLGNHF